MSVVNQVLRDLESRQDSSRQLPLQPVAAEAGNKRGLFWLIVVVILACCLLAANLYFTPFGFQADQNIAQIKVERLTEPAAETTIPAQNSDQVLVEPKLSSNKAAEKTIVLAKTKAIQTAEKIAEDKSETLIDKAPAQATLSKIEAEPVKQITEPVKTAQTAEPAEAKPQKAPAQQQPAPVKKLSSKTALLKQLNSIKKDATLFDSAQTITSVQHLLANQPDFHAARLYLIKLLWQANDPTTAGVIDQAIESYPAVTAFQLTAGRYYLKTAQLVKAEQSLFRIKSGGSGATELLQLRAIVRQKLNKHRLAVNDYSEILKLSPDRGDIYLALGISLDALQQASQARLSFQQALKDNRLSAKQRQFIKNKINSY